MSNVPAVTMEDLELEHAELLPSRETLWVCHPSHGGSSFTQVGYGNTAQSGLLNVAVAERQPQQHPQPGLRQHPLAPPARIACWPAAHRGVAWRGKGPPGRSRAALPFRRPVAPGCAPRHSDFPW